MINLSTSSDELWRVLITEHDKAVYWMKKHFGTEKRYEQMRDNLLSRCMAAERPLTSEIVDYLSKEGNRWVCFEQTTYYPGSRGAFCLPVALCYYETAASLGVFFIGYLHQNGIDTPDSVFIYTPHFFQRFAERLKIQGSPRDILMRFIEMAPSFTISPIPSEDGRKKMMIRIPGCVCHGIMREDSNKVYEIRTLLTDDQLSSKQSRETKKAREVGDAVKFEPDDIMRGRLKQNDDSFLAWYDEVKKMEDLGIDMTDTKLSYGMSLIITETFFKMGVADRDDPDFWKNYSAKHKPPFEYYFRRKQEKGDHFNFVEEMGDLAKEIAGRMGIRKFKRSEFMKAAFGVKEEDKTKL